jgi:hypothetical protein
MGHGKVSLETVLKNSGNDLSPKVHKCILTTGCNGHTLDITGLQYYRLSLVLRYNCCILGTFGTPQQTPSTNYYTPPRFILKDTGVQLNWEILQKPV